MKNEEKCDYRMLFLNPDGRPAAMCGNGARCAAFFAYRNGIAEKQQRIQTTVGSVEAEIVEVAEDTAHVRITVPEPRPPVEKRIVIEGHEWVCLCLNTGVPHAVIFVDDVNTVDVKRIGCAIRNHEAFAPEGTNVNFVSSGGVPAADGGTEAAATFLRIRTYERGVEDESGACGTGAIAAAVAIWNGEWRMENGECRFKTSSGDTLVVQKSNEGLTLSGPAVIVFHGEMNI